MVLRGEGLVSFRKLGQNPRRTSPFFYNLRSRKKGLSPVVASVLLILLVMVMATLVFLWARGFLGEQIEKFGDPIEHACERIKFDAVLVDSDLGLKSLEITNYGDVDIFNLDVKKFYKGDSETEEFTFNVDNGSSVVQPVTLVMTEGSYTGVPEKIIIYPSIIGNVKGKDTNKPYVCDERGVTLYVEDNNA